MFLSCCISFIISFFTMLLLILDAFILTFNLFWGFNDSFWGKILFISVSCEKNEFCFLFWLAVTELVLFNWSKVVNIFSLLILLFWLFSLKKLLYLLSKLIFNLLLSLFFVTLFISVVSVLIVSLLLILLFFIISSFLEVLL